MGSGRYLLFLPKKETERATMSTGEFVLAPEYSRYAVPVNVWLSKPNEDRERILTRFFNNRRPNIPGVSTSTDCQLSIPTNPNAGKKTKPKVPQKG